VLDALANPDLWPTVANAIVAVYGTVTLIAGRRQLRRAQSLVAAQGDTRSVTPCHDSPRATTVSHAPSRPVTGSVHLHVSQAVPIFIEAMRQRGGGSWDHDDIVTEFDIYRKRKGWRQWPANEIRRELSDRKYRTYVKKWRRSDGARPMMYDIEGAAVEKPKEFALPTGVAEAPRKIRVV
jgi:hypothetical protein